MFRQDRDRSPVLIERRTRLASIPAFSLWPSQLRGILFMAGAAFFATLLNVVIRFAAPEVHAFEIAFFRNLFGTLLLLPMLHHQGLGALRTDQPLLHGLRAVLNASAMLCFFWAVTVTPMATIAALGFTSPIFATILAMLVLGERVGIRRWSGVVLGFAGALIILRPGIEVVSPGALTVLLAAALWAGAMTVIKHMSAKDSSLTITLWASLLLIPFTFLPALWVWTWPSLGTLGLLVLAGLFGSLTQLCLTQAFKETEASVVLPIDFTKLIWSVLFGFLLFQEWPDFWTLAGAVLIFSSISYIAVREQARRQPSKAPHRLS